MGSSDIVLITIDLPMRVKENKSNLKFFLQKTCLKESLWKPKLKIKVKFIKEQIDLQKLDLNIKVEEGLETYIINQIDNQRFNKYLYYHWIQQSII